MTATLDPYSAWLWGKNDAAAGRPHVNPYHDAKGPGSFLAWFYYSQGWGGKPRPHSYVLEKHGYQVDQVTGAVTRRSEAA